MLRGTGKMRNGKKQIILLFTIILIQFFLPLTLAGQTGEQIELQLSINKRECYTGESMILQALVKGTDVVEIGSLPEPDWGTITYLGGQRRNSQSSISINGKFTRIEEKGFLMSFQITPEGPGEFIVPEISFNADGEILHSSPFSIKTKDPEKSDDYAMEITAGLESLYPGQEFVLDVKWYYRKGARNLGFSLPFLDEFEFLGQIPSRGKIYEIVLNNMTVQATGEEGYCETFGEKATFLAFSLILKAGNPGIYNLSESTSRFEGVTGTETVRDFFGNRQLQEKYSTLVINSSGASLTVLPLPAPPYGSGIAGNTTILGPASVTAELSKTEISIGEPVTLSLTFSGAANSNYSIPPLGEQTVLNSNFSVPPERSPGKNEGDERTFVQTVRVKNGTTTEFPSLKFNVFNTETALWEEIETAPVSISVLSTQIADSGDLEIFETSGPVVRELEKNKSGLELSFSGPELLIRSRGGYYPWINPILFILILLIPPALWLFLFLRKIRFFGKRRSGTAEFRKFLKSWKKEELHFTLFESALTGFLEAETGKTGRSIYGFESEFKSSPAGLEAYNTLKSILDREIYSAESDTGESGRSVLRKELTENGEILLKEITK